MHVVFRADASLEMGTGHVMRCLTLANALEKKNAKITFVSRAFDGHLGALITKLGYQLILLPKPMKQLIGEKLYQRWLGVSQHEDAAQTTAALSGIIVDLLVVDNYALSDIWERRINDHVKKLMTISDFKMRLHCCDFILDQNFVRAGKMRYNGYVPKNCIQMLGPEFALLRSDFAKEALAKPYFGAHEPRHMLVYFGGSDLPNITGKVVDALCDQTLSHLHLHIVIGQHYPYRDVLEQTITCRGRSSLYSGLPNLAALMAQCDVAVGAGGTTTWERLCMKLPSLVVVTAENQRQFSQDLAYDGFQMLSTCDHTSSKHEWRNELLKFLSETEKLHIMSKKGSQLVDGNGSDRVIDIIFS